MAAKIFRINYKSDFILTLNSDAGWMTPFCIKFWTGAPSQAFYVGWDGTTYTHCDYDPSEPTKLVVQFDDHHLPIGDLKFQIAYHFTVADFPNDTEDEVINPSNITTEIDGQEYQVMLDFTGETAPEIQFSLPAYANEAQRIANEQQRIANEQQRIQDEETRIAHEETRQENEAQRIAQETARVNEFATLKSQSQAATRDANDAATLANQKAEYAQQQGGYAKDQGDYAKNQGDYAKEQGDTALADHQRAEVDHTQAGNDHTRAESDHGIAVDDHTQAGTDHTRAESDHGIAVDDHTQAGSDHTRAESDHGIAVDDHTQAGSDHTRAESDHGIAVDDHTQAGTDHQTAQSDHTIAGNDHTQAGSDHTRAESDHTRAESDHAAVEVYVDSLGAFDISAYHATGGVLAKYADLTAALGTNGANIPDALRKGGMSVKFVLSSDNNSVNKYVQYRLMNQTFSDNVAYWIQVAGIPIIFNINEFKAKSDAYTNKATAYIAIPTTMRVKGMIVTYLYSVNGVSDWITEQFIGSDLGNWALTSEWQLITAGLPYKDPICDIEYINLFIADLRLVSGYLGDNYTYYIRSCYIRNGKLYVGIKAKNTVDTSEQEKVVFDNELNEGYNTITKNGHTWECIINLNVNINSRFIEYPSSGELNSQSTLKAFCFDSEGHFLIDIYKKSYEATSKIDTIWANSYVDVNKIPYTLVAGYYNSTGGIEGTTSSYKSISPKIKCKKGDIFKFDDFWNVGDMGDATIAFYVYDSNGVAIGNRINKADLSPDANNVVIYTITQKNAAYIGISTNKAEQGGLYRETYALTNDFVASIRNDDTIAKEVDLIMFMGQSNMAGRGVVNPSNPETSVSVPLKYGREFRAISDPTKLYPIADPFGYNENTSGGIDDGTQKKGSLIPAFVNSYYETTGVPVIAVSASEGATNIIQWQPSGDLLPDAITRLNTCLSFLQANEFTVRHIYMAWCQGENDYENRENYETLFRNVVDAMKSVGVEKCLLIRIGRNNSSGNVAQDFIVNIQTQMAKEYSDIILVSTAFASFKGSMQDGQHFYQDQYNEVGRQAGNNAGIWANFQKERTQYDCMHKVDANIPELYISDKCY